MLALAGGLATAHGAPPAGDVWREAPEYVPLFAAAGPRRAAYRMYVSALDLPAVLPRLAAERGRLSPPGAWQPSRLLPADAFGQAGAYDRWLLARVYGARRPLVARGPVGNGSLVTETWTLISPYPDVSLRRLEPGTLLIVLSLGSP